MTQHTEEQVKSWERHISTIASAIVISLLVWMGSSVINMGNDITAIKVKLENAVDIQHSLSQIQADHGTFSVRLENVNDRVTRIEKAQGEEDERERKEHGGKL